MFKEPDSQVDILKYACHHFELIDPRGRPIVMSGSDHYFHTRCLSVPTFQIRAKQNHFQVRIMIATGVTVGIIDDTHVLCMLYLTFHPWSI